MRAFAIGGWILILSVLFAWQGVGLVKGPEWPTMSDMLRGFLRTWPGRWALFGVWLWLGWHLFARGREALFGGFQ